MTGVRGLAELVDALIGGERRPPRRQRGRDVSAAAPHRARARSASTSAISPALPRRCKYHPTCSAYAVQAIESYGILRGAVLAAWRLLRCNPFSHGGLRPRVRTDALPLARRPDSLTHS